MQRKQRLDLLQAVSQKCSSGVFVLTGIMNRFRLAKLSYIDQFIMAYGGLRGAVAYGLAASLLEHSVLAEGTKKMYLTTTIVVTLFTVFVMVSG